MNNLFAKAITSSIQANKDKIEKLTKQNLNLKNKNKKLKEENQRLNNDIKILLKENEAKEKVIIKQDNVLNELEKWLKEELEDFVIETKNENAEILSYSLPIKGEIKKILNKLNELKESDK